MGDHEPRDPALTQLDDIYDDPRHNPIAFIPVPEDEIDPDQMPPEAQHHHGGAW